LLGYLSNRTLFWLVGWFISLDTLFCGGLQSSPSYGTLRISWGTVTKER